MFLFSSPQNSQVYEMLSLNHVQYQFSESCFDVITLVSAHSAVPFSLFHSLSLSLSKQYLLWAFHPSQKHLSSNCSKMCDPILAWEPMPMWHNSANQGSPWSLTSWRECTFRVHDCFYFYFLWQEMAQTTTTVKIIT